MRDPTDPKPARSRRLFALLALAAIAVVVTVAWMLRDPGASGAIEIDATSQEIARTAAQDLDDVVDVEPASSSPRVVPEAPPELDPARAELERKIQSFVDRRGPCTLTVRVVEDETSRPIPGAEVEILSANGLITYPPATTDERGLARFESIHAGAFNASATSPGRAPATSGAYLRGEAPEASVEIRMQLEHVVLVRAVDESGRAFTSFGEGGAPTPTFGIGIAPACERIGDPYAGTGAPSYRVGLVDAWRTPLAWRVTIAGRDPVCVHIVLGSVVLGAAPIDAWTEEVAVRVDAALLARATAPIVVRVVGHEDGAPIAEAVVELVDGEQRKIARTTDVDGRARFDADAGGDVVVTARAPRRAELRTIVSRPIDGEVVLRLRAGRRIAGTMVDQDGRPMPRARVALYSAEQAGSSQSAPLLAVGDTGVDGRFEFADRAPGQYGVGTHLGSGYVVLPAVRDWKESLVLADARDGDVLGVVVRGFRPRIVVEGPDWDPPPYPKR